MKATCGFNVIWVCENPDHWELSVFTEYLHWAKLCSRNTSDSYNLGFESCCLPAVCWIISAKVFWSSLESKALHLQISYCILFSYKNTHNYIGSCLYNTEMESLLFICTHLNGIWFIFIQYLAKASTPLTFL